MSEAITLLDGGMGRELKRMGAPFRQPEWSALALIEQPDTVAVAHRAFVDAGAEVITTNNYAVVPFHLGVERFERDGRRLTALSGEIARGVAGSASAPVRVAGSLPPLFGSYRPDLFDPAGARRYLPRLVEDLEPHVDLWLGETIGSLAEFSAVVTALRDSPLPLWASFTVSDEPGDEGRVIRSGETIEQVAAAVAVSPAEGLMFNCSQPEYISLAVERLAEWGSRQGGLPRYGAYANAFTPRPPTAEANSDNAELRDDMDADAYLSFVRRWLDHGATLVGGCCGIGPEHIAAINELLHPR